MARNKGLENHWIKHEKERAPPPPDPPAAIASNTNQVNATHAMEEEDQEAAATNRGTNASVRMEVVPSIATETTITNLDGTDEPTITNLKALPIPNLNAFITLEDAN